MTEHQNCCANNLAQGEPASDKLVRDLSHARETRTSVVD
jgi:hypothetical protein